MANLTATVRNTLFVYGSEPTSKWDVFVWDRDPWTWFDVQWTDYKNVPNTMVLTATRAFDVLHKVDDNITLDTVISRQFPARTGSTFVVSSSIRSVYRINNGWYDTKGGITNVLSFPVDTFSEVSDPTTSWSEVARPSTTWT